MAQQDSNGTSLTKDLIYGALGGIAGTIALERVTTWMYGFEDEEKRKLEERIRPEAPFTTLARRIAVSVTGEPPSDNALSKLSMGVHWGYGIAWGALYGALHDRVQPAVRFAPKSGS